MGLIYIQEHVRKFPIYAKNHRFLSKNVGYFMINGKVEFFECFPLPNDALIYENNFEKDYS